ncbi:MAG: hypothetical protein KKD01_10340 [Proteobacteria bacterium]|nr:hypothetical protein [Pseudomonadota bacterium]MBU1234695.1 hypothetical protein [Pseudomonadota bacterium]MBU1419154.1 hypothetical protein [Pseudomonadota bacterium]MBU1455112.1 hypothetical protein [Pseudomonadota bacterium]
MTLQQRSHFRLIGSAHEVGKRLVNLIKRIYGTAEKVLVEATVSFVA